MAPDFYPSHLQRVSRSFAFCIAQLEGDFRDWVSLSYLLCRILDTVEDAQWPGEAQQARAFREFQGFLEAPVSEPELGAWIRSFPAGISEGERLLIEDANGCFVRFHALPKNIQAILRASILNMYRGMRYFATERRQRAAIRLRDLADVNQYCFFVAGVVGDLLTHLLAGASNIKVSSAQLLDAHHFGLFLQKVNLLKDQRADEAEGRFLVAPSREAVLASAKANAEGALRYILELPIAERGYRMFCAWSLFMGLSTLRWMQFSSCFGRIFMNKPPRLFTKRTLLRVADRIDDNEALEKLFAISQPRIPKAQAAARGSEGAALLAYDGPLQGTQFRALGLL